MLQLTLARCANGSSQAHALQGDVQAAQESGATAGELLPDVRRHGESVQDGGAGGPAAAPVGDADAPAAKRALPDDAGASAAAPAPEGAAPPPDALDSTTEPPPPAPFADDAQTAAPPQSNQEAAAITGAPVPPPPPPPPFAALVAEVRLLHSLTHLLGGDAFVGHACARVQDEQARTAEEDLSVFLDDFFADTNNYSSADTSRQASSTSQQPAGPGAAALASSRRPELPPPQDDAGTDAPAPPALRARVLAGPFLAASSDAWRDNTLVETSTFTARVRVPPPVLPPSAPCHPPPRARG